MNFPKNLSYTIKGKPTIPKYARRAPPGPQSFPLPEPFQICWAGRSGPKILIVFLFFRKILTLALSLLKM